METLIESVEVCSQVWTDRYEEHQQQQISDDVTAHKNVSDIG